MFPAEGMAFVKAGSPLFTADSVLVSQLGGTGGTISAFDLDANGDPITTSRRTFIDYAVAPQGMVVDPLTGDLLLNSTGGGLWRVEGFVPEPSFGLLGLVGAMLCTNRTVARRRRTEPHA